MGCEKEVSVSEDVKPFLNEIAERLWTGHAAIMIGAGFSKNAIPALGGKNTFPDWNELGDIFYHKIHGKIPGKDAKYLSPIKLAEEVRAAFGRPVLDELLRENIPDGAHNPNLLFTKLLQLEWSDVFTTNYDTLLERAKDNVTDRNYQIVVRKDDLVKSKSPRIIKLHGSFPSQTPFIITEEDYRTYPKKFAPFVNTVQQALLEKTLCLVGFSGDDPNFLKWIGWIRDNFEESSALKIYLIGIINLSDVQKKLLDQRNVNIIDLRSCQGVDGKHYLAFERFFDYLNSKKIDGNRLGWPGKESTPNFNTDKKIDQVKRVVDEWRTTREDFPGWRVVPRDRRVILNQSAQSWTRFVDEILLPDFVDIEYLFEFCWRQEKGLLPIWDDIAKKVEECLEKYWPFSDAEKSHSSLVRISASGDIYKGDWNVIRHYWMQLSLYMLRYYREEGQHEKWKSCEQILKGVSSYLSQEQTASFGYEKALQRLFLLDIPGLKAELEIWKTDKSLPYWEAKRAGLLAEVGLVTDAEKIVETALKNVREQQNLKPISVDYSDVSDEAYLMLLLQCVKQSSLLLTDDYSSLSDVVGKFSERLNILHQYKCNPWDELDYFNNSLDRPYIERPNIEKEHQFRIGYITTNRHWGNNSEEACLAFSFLRFSEDVGLPFHFPGLNISSKSAQGCLPRIESLTPHWALITLLRIGDKKAVKEIFSRKSLLQLSASQCDDLIDLYLQKINEYKAEIGLGRRGRATNFGENLAKMIPEILSRLCCKCSFESKEKLISFVVEVYSSENKASYEGIGNLVKTLLDSMTEEHKYQSIPKILSIPIPENLDRISATEFLNPLQFLDINVKGWSSSGSIIIDGERITYLIKSAASKDEFIRGWALYSLADLHDLNLLSEQQKIGFGNAIWSQKDETGFPSNTGFYRFAWDCFPKPENIDFELLLENYIHNLEIPVQTDSTKEGVGITGGYDHDYIAQELIGASKVIKLDSETLLSLLVKVESWWEGDCSYLKDSSETIADEFRVRFYSIPKIIAKVILPNLIGVDEVGQEEKDSIPLLINNLQSSGVPVAQVKAAYACFDPGCKNDAILDIEKYIISNDERRVLDAIEAIFIIIKDSGDIYTLEDQVYLIDLALHAITWQSRSCLPSILYLVSSLYTDYPLFFDGEKENSLCLGLEVIAENTDLNNDKSTLSFEDRLNVRQGAANLAYKVYLRYIESNQHIPTPVQTWRSICGSDQEFAEIRNQWG